MGDDMTISKIRRAARCLAAAFALAAGLASEADAAIVQSGRTAAFGLSYSDAQFDNALLSRTVTFIYPAQAPFNFGATATLGPNASNFSNFAGGGLSVGPVTGSNPYHFNGSSNGAAGFWGWSWDLTPVTPSSFELDTSGAHPELIFKLNPTASGAAVVNQDTVVLAVLPGDWSKSGTSPGEHELLGFDPAFTLMQDFVYDAASKTTTVEVEDKTYGSGQQINLNFVLFGGAAAAVPEPGTWALMLLGVALAGASVRRRRRAGAIAAAA